MNELTKADIQRASKIAVKSMNKKLKELSPADLQALENLRNASNNFVPVKIKNKGVKFE